MPSSFARWHLFFESMKAIRSVHFMKSAVKPAHYPQHNLPEIAFIGRSNVGKSSLLNTLVNKKNLARISNTPGRTQLINFFNVEDTICFVDLPGYGFAKVPQSTKKQWKPMIEAYLMQSQHLRSVVLIVDARHRPSKHDVTMYEWLGSYQVPTILVATKIDKLPKTKLPKQLRLIEKILSIRPEEEIFPFSALTKSGFQAIWKAIWQATTIPT